MTRRYDGPSGGAPFEPIKYTSDVFPTERADAGHSHVPKRTKRKRRRYHPRPEPRRRMDLLGFNGAMWLLAVVLLLVVLLLLWF